MLCGADGKQEQTAQILVAARSAGLIAALAMAEAGFAVTLRAEVPGTTAALRR